MRPCRSCKASITFRPGTGLLADRLSPINDDPSPDGPLTIEPDGSWRWIEPGEFISPVMRFHNHFSTCPDASTYKRPRTTSAEPEQSTRVEPGQPTLDGLDSIERRKDDRWTS